MSKGLEALERNRNFIERYFVKQVEETGVYHKDMKDAMFNDLSIVEKELQTLEIFKSKKVHIKWLLNSNSCEEYNKWYDIPLTEEEYELLKEVLL